MIAACPSRHGDAAEPLIIVRPSQTVLFMLDGSGSWGRGVEAAAWFRNWLEDAFESNDIFTRASVTDKLQAGIERLPSEIKNDVFHWTFSIVALIADQNTLQLGACGGFAASIISPLEVVPLFSPPRVIDHFVAIGKIQESEAESHRLAPMLVGPFFGVDGQDDLPWIAPFEFVRPIQIVVGAPALHRYLRAQTSYQWLEDPIALRDAVEKFSGRSPPTAIVSFP